jgi:hypothetical protein
MEWVGRGGSAAGPTPTRLSAAVCSWAADEKVIFNGFTKPVPALAAAFVLTASLADASLSPAQLTAVADACGMRRLQRCMPLHVCGGVEYC